MSLHCSGQRERIVHLRQYPSVLARVDVLLERGERPLVPPEERKGERDDIAHE